MTNPSDHEAEIRVAPPAGASDREWLRKLWRDEWGGEVMVTKGRVHHVDDAHALVAWRGGERAGAAAFRVDADGCELLSLNAIVPGRGVGSALLRHVEQAARAAGAKRVWLITSNDNLNALRFYQRQGYRLVAVYPGAIDEARKLKPAIPLVGDDGIPVRDEIELEKALDA